MLGPRARVESAGAAWNAWGVHGCLAHPSSGPVPRHWWSQCSALPLKVGVAVVGVLCGGTVEVCAHECRGVRVVCR